MLRTAESGLWALLLVSSPVPTKLYEIDNSSNPSRTGTYDPSRAILNLELSGS